MSPGLKEVQTNLSEQVQLLQIKIYKAMIEGDRWDPRLMKEAEQQANSVHKSLKELNGNSGN